ncbi:hypothetical protein K431DRAFT_282201 [Polychaeton citri CBS 116435]|uniref:Uncharacterized protein n=1 Tax=Polychaeton citri CBS 116435 TaxID=1314669 RepID=A0A9P4QGK6_9PEZI|nr:hypothetical protein K431DRAFT_282201 [Polychaeton citri CBS 116435]
MLTGDTRALPHLFNHQDPTQHRLKGEAETRQPASASGVLHAAMQLEVRRAGQLLFKPHTASPFGPFLPWRSSMRRRGHGHVAAPSRCPPLVLINLDACSAHQLACGGGSRFKYNLHGNNGSSPHGWAGGDDSRSTGNPHHCSLLLPHCSCPLSNTIETSSSVALRRISNRTGNPSTATKGGSRTSRFWSQEWASKYLFLSLASRVMDPGLIIAPNPCLAVRFSFPPSSSPASRW